VREDRIVFTSEDLLLGDGLALVRTPGHTSGNQTLFIKTDRGVWGCSENGVCVDNWSPSASRIPGVASTAKHAQHDVVLNSNTMEGRADQYTSMILEKTLVDRVPEAPDFCQMFSSSEAEPTVFSPGLEPTYRHFGITHGTVEVPQRASREESSHGYGASAGA
jgi:hypothetical protein